MRTKSHSAGRAGDVAADDAEGLAERALDDGDAVHQRPRARRCRRRAGRRGRRRGPRRDRSWRRASRRRRGCPRSARCRRPSNRRSRRRRASARRPAYSDRMRSRSAGSLCFHSRFSARRWRMPSIIEAWLPSSEKMTQPGMLRAERRQRRPVRDVAGGEQQRRFLAVQVGELALEQHVVVVGAGDVARAAGAGAAAVERLVHGRDHLRMLAHAEIVVRAPDGDLAGGAVAHSAWRAGTRRPGARDRRRPGSGLPGAGRRASLAKKASKSMVFLLSCPAWPVCCAFHAVVVNAPNRSLAIGAGEWCLAWSCRCGASWR